MGAAPVSAINHDEQAPSGQQEAANRDQPAQAVQQREEGRAGLTEMIREAKEKADAQRESFELSKAAPRYGDAPLEAYARLSRARNAAQAGSAAGYARRRIAQLQAAQGADPDHIDQIRAAIGQLRKAVVRANRKKLELSREELARARQKRLIREKRNREAKRQRYELQSRQSMRKIREGGYFQEAEVANRLASQLAATKMELREQARQLGSSAQKSLDAAVQQYSSAQTAAASEIPAPVVDVQA